MKNVKLETTSAAADRLPNKPTRATTWRWLKQYPGLGVRIGGRGYLHTAAVDAIASGMPLDQAARLVAIDGGRAT